MTGTLKARVGGAWVPILGGGPGPSAANALGIVAMGSLVSGSPLTLTANAVTQVTTTVNYTMAVGRRFRVVLAVRGIQSLSTATYIQSFLRDGTTNIPSASGPLWVSPQTTYGSIYYGWTFDGDGVNRNWNAILLSVNIGSNAYTADQGYFYVEDVGPNMSPALPIPATPPAWTPLPLNTNWSAIGGYQTPQYRKIGDLVHVRGDIQLTAGGANPMATLPVGFRPPGHCAVPTVLGSGGPAGAYVRVMPTGAIEGVGFTQTSTFFFNTQFSTTP